MPFKPVGVDENSHFPPRVEARLAEDFGGGPSSTASGIASVRLTTTENITRSGLLVIDGVQTVAGDAVLVRHQTNGAENGIFTVASGAWARHTDFDTSAKLAAATVRVLEGSTRAGYIYHTRFKAADTLGTTAMRWGRVMDALDITTKGDLLVGSADGQMVRLGTNGIPGNTIIQDPEAPSGLKWGTPEAPLVTLANLPGGSTFAIFWNASTSSWIFNGQPITDRPTDRTELHMLAFGGSASPTFMDDDHDVWFEETA